MLNNNKIQSYLLFFVFLFTTIPNAASNEEIEFRKRQVKVGLAASGISGGVLLWENFKKAQNEKMKRSKGVNRKNIMPQLKRATRAARAAMAQSLENDIRVSRNFFIMGLGYAAYHRLRQYFDEKYR
jgi:hypothetical protein